MSSTACRNHPGRVIQDVGSYVREATVCARENKCQCHSRAMFGSAPSLFFASLQTRQAQVSRLILRVVGNCCCGLGAMFSTRDVTLLSASAGKSVPGPAVPARADRLRSPGPQAPAKDGRINAEISAFAGEPWTTSHTTADDWIFQMNMGPLSTVFDLMRLLGSSLEPSQNVGHEFIMLL